MAFTAYQYYGEANQTGDYNFVSFYADEGLTSYAFTIGAAYAEPYTVGDCNVLFDVALGSLSTGTTYYASGSRQLVPSAGDSKIGIFVSGIDNAGIGGIGARVSGNGSNCYYESAGIGVYTPTLEGYDFTPASDSSSGGIGVLTFSVEEAASPPDKATSPSPANSATGVSLTQATLTWTEGVGSDYEQVYFGPSGDMSLVDDNDTDQSFSLASYLPFPYGTTYQWRIDSVNDEGTTTGDVWSFTTMEFTPPGVSVFQVVKRLCACAENRFWFEDI